MIKVSKQSTCERTADNGQQTLSKWHRRGSFRYRTACCCCCCLAFGVQTAQLDDIDKENSSRRTGAAAAIAIVAH